MEVSEKYQKLAESWLVQHNLDHFLDVVVLNDTDFKVKEDGLVGQVKNATKPWNQLPSVPDVVVIVNEDILDQLENEYGLNYRDFAFESLLNYISWDTDNDKFMKIKPDVVTHSGMLENDRFNFESFRSHKEALRQIQENNQED